MTTADIVKVSTDQVKASGFDPASRSAFAVPQSTGTNGKNVAVNQFRAFVKPGNDAFWTIGERITWGPSKELFKELGDSLVMAVQNGSLNGLNIEELRQEIHSSTPREQFKAALNALIAKAKTLTDTGLLGLSDRVSRGLAYNKLDEDAFKLITWGGGSDTWYGLVKREIGDLPPRVSNTDQSHLRSLPRPPSKSSETGNNYVKLNQAPVQNSGDKTRGERLTQQSCLGRSCRSSSVITPGQDSPSISKSTTSEQPGQDLMVDLNALNKEGQAAAEAGAVAYKASGAARYKELLQHIQPTIGILSDGIFSNIKDIKANDKNQTQGLVSKAFLSGFTALKAFGLLANPEQLGAPGLDVQGLSGMGGAGGILGPNLGQSMRRPRNSDALLDLVYSPGGIWGTPEFPMWVNPALMFVASFVGSYLDNKSGRVNTSKPIETVRDSTIKLGQELEKVARFLSVQENYASAVKRFNTDYKNLDAKITEMIDNYVKLVRADFGGLTEQQQNALMGVGTNNNYVSLGSVVHKYYRANGDTAAIANVNLDASALNSRMISAINEIQQVKNLMGYDDRRLPPRESRRERK